MFSSLDGFCDDLFGPKEEIEGLKIMEVFKSTDTEINLHYQGKLGGITDILNKDDAVDYYNYHGGKDIKIVNGDNSYKLVDSIERIFGYLEWKVPSKSYKYGKRCTLGKYKHDDENCVYGKGGYISSIPNCFFRVYATDTYMPLEEVLEKHLIKSLGGSFNFDLETVADSVVCGTLIDLKLGNHDLLKIFKEIEGKFVHILIDFKREVKVEEKEVKTKQLKF